MIQPGKANLCLQFHVHDFATFGETLLLGIQEVNKYFAEIESDQRLIQNIDLGEEVYDIYMAKKKSGKPKDEDPSK